MYHGIAGLRQQRWFRLGAGNCRAEERGRVEEEGRGGGGEREKEADRDTPASCTEQPTTALCEPPSLMSDLWA